MLGRTTRRMAHATIAAVVAATLGVSVAYAAPTINSLQSTTLTTAGNNVVTYTGYMNGESFQQDAIRTFNGWQYAVFWDTGRQVNISRRQLPSGSWQNIDLTSYTTSSTDSHNVISMGISHTDGTIHLAYDMHNNGLRYRVSVPGLATNPTAHSWTADKFSAHSTTLKGLALPGSLTYPAFISSLGGKLQMTIREGASGGGDQLLYEYNAGGASGRWTSVGKIIEGGDANAYMFGQEYSPGRCLHMTWTMRETSNPSTNHDLYYAYSCDEGRTWNNNAGSRIATTGSDPLTVSKAGVRVWSIGQNRGLINQESQFVSNDGVVHVLASHMPDGEASDSNFTNARNKARLVHYWRDPSTRVWSRTVTSYGEQSQRGDIVADRSGNVYIVHGHTADHKLRVATASKSAGYKDWAVRYTSGVNYFSDPLIDQWRMKSEDRLSVFATRHASSTIDVLTWTAVP